MGLCRVVLIGAFLIAVAIPGVASSTENWQRYTDKILQITFRHPKEWKTSPAYSDRTYFGGPDGALQLSASQGDTPQQVCHGEAIHHLQPFGSNPRIRSMKVQGQKACLIWPSEEQGANADAELVVQFPRPVMIDGNSYSQLTLYADKNHILQIMQTLRFISPTSQQE
jgi:TolB protein